MTSRLKHKLELENINLKSAYLNESFVLIGTPLPDLASTKKDKLEYVPEWQQEVRDEQGRRRFHGAFTGGFSAGYFNSVGSKEGWAPTEFKSSRSSRVTKVQRAEDFMDEEDVQHMKDDRQLENTTTFRSVEGKQDVLESLIRPAQTSIGQTLLTKIGWKEGQGIGPRVSLRKLRKKQGAVVDEDDPALEHTFPPSDVRLVVYGNKEDRHGLGFSRDHRSINLGEGSSKWHDGKAVLSAFTLDPAGVPRDKWFTMPNVPEDWRPRPARIWGTTRRWDNEEAPKANVIRGETHKPLTHEERGAALGEEVRKPEVLVIPPLSPRTASAALQGFIPYGDDLVKQERYRSYLSSQTYNTKTPNPTLRLGTIEEINKEMADFSASARIFKPMSFAMSNRFTSGSASLATTDLKQPKAGLHMHTPEAAKPADPVKAEPPKTAREHAATTGNYGPATRESRPFYPEKLLCKRCGVQNPHPDGEPRSTPVEVPKPAWDETLAAHVEEEPGERRPTTLAEVGMADDSQQGRDTLSYVKPSIDIFKAIFETEEEEEVDELVGPADVPARIALEEEETTVESPSQPVDDKEAERPVDLATFKPVFKARKEKTGDEKKKKDKKRKGVLSFDTGDDDEERKRPKPDEPEQ